ncbi:DUF6541 family protein [Corynebacterium sp. S7]
MSTEVAIWVAIAVFMLPGLIIALVSGLKLPAAVASAMPVTFGIVGLSAWVWGALHVSFNWATFLVFWFVVLVVATLWRWMFLRREIKQQPGISWRERLWGGKNREGSIFDPSWILPAAGVIVGAWLLISKQVRWLKATPGGVNNIVQGWDSQWHANLVRFIMEEGVASATRMGELQNLETHAVMLYPSGFHAGTALFAQAASLDPIPAVNLASIVGPSLALAMSMACIVWSMVGNRGLVYQIGAGLAPILVFATPVIIWIGNYVGAWPYLFAMTMTGMVIAQFIGVPRNHVTALAAVFGFLGLIQVHPSSVTVVALAVGIFWLFYQLWAPATTRLKDFFWLVSPAVVGALLYLPQILAGSTQAEEVASWERDGELTNAEAWSRAFFMDTRHVKEFFPNFDPTILLWLALIGALFVVVWQRLIWVAVTYVVFLVVLVHSLRPFDGWFGNVLETVTAVHYNGAHRLVMPVAMIVIAGAAVGIAVLIRVITFAPLAARAESPRWARVTGALSVVLAVVAGWGATWWVTDTSEDAARAIFKSSRVTGRMVNEDDLAAFDWLGSQPAAYEGLTMGEPADGHSWIYAYNGVPTVSRHYQWPNAGDNSSTKKLYAQGYLLGAGTRDNPTAPNVIDKAAEALDVRFFLISPYNFWAQQTNRWELTRGLWATKGVTPVYRKGSTVIFAVNAAFTEAELSEMERSAVEAGSDPLGNTANERASNQTSSPVEATAGSFYTGP